MADQAPPTASGQNTMSQDFSSRGSVEEVVEETPDVNTELFVLLLIALTIHVFELSSAAIKFRRAFKEIKAEIFLKITCFQAQGT